jgi:hypothetical protein
MLKLIAFAAGIVIGYHLRDVLDNEDQGPGELDIIFEAEFENHKIKGVIKEMELREGFKQLLKAGNARTRRGNPAALEPGSVTWTSTDESIVSVTPDPENELQAWAEGLDGSENGTVAVEVRADGRPGEGVREVIGNVAITCTQGDAAIFDVAPEGEPVEVETPPAEGGEGPGNEAGSETPATEGEPATVPGSGDAGTEPLDDGVHPNG